MPGGIDQVQDVWLAILRFVIKPHGVRLNRNPPLTLEVHVVKYLRLHIAARHGPG